MLIAALAQGRPIIVTAMMTAAIIQATAIQSPPNPIQRMFSKSEKKDISPLMDTNAKSHLGILDGFASGVVRDFRARERPFGNRIVFAWFSGWLGHGAPSPA